MPLAAPLANLSVYYATCLPRLKTEWTDTTAAEYLLERISNKIKKSSEALVGEKKIKNYSKVFSKTTKNPIIHRRAYLCADKPPHRIKPLETSRLASLSSKCSIENTF